MKREDFDDDLFSMFFGPGRDKWAWLWNPFHPSALFCVLCAIVAMVVVSLLTRGGG